MPLQPVAPQSDKSMNSYHQKLSWKIRKEDWDSREEFLQLGLYTKIPGSNGGFVVFGKGRKKVGFITQWPKDVDHTKIKLDALFTITLDDGSFVRIKCDNTLRSELEQRNSVIVDKQVKLDVELLFNVEGFFTFEAELKVTQEEPNNEEKSSHLDFVKNIAGIFSDLKTSDVVVSAGAEKFHCHKNILRARCEVFKNMLAPNTAESESNSIELKDIPAEAVRSMLKYIYNGEVPDDPENLTLDLLNLSEMYLLDHLKKACLDSLIDRLEVSSCISTFILADRYGPSGGNLRDMVMKFMKCKAGEVVETEDWDKLVDNHPTLAKEVLRAIAKGVREKHKCTFCVVSYDV